MWRLTQYKILNCFPTIVVWWCRQWNGEISLSLIHKLSKTLRAQCVFPGESQMVVGWVFATWSSKQNNKFWVLQNTTYHLHQNHQNCDKEFSQRDYQNETISFGFFRIRHIICTKFTKIIVSSCNVTIKTKTFKFTGYEITCVPNSPGPSRFG